MNLTGHIVRKDLFRLRWVLVLWVVVLTARMALANIQADLDVVGYYPFYIMAWVFGILFLPLLGFGLVMGAQGDDPASDTDAFWITRPISGGRLLGARCTVLVLLWLIPPLATAPWWIAHGFDFRQFCTAFFQTARWQTVLTLVALPFAVTSSTASRFVMSVMLAVVGAFTLILAARFFGSGSGAPALPGIVVSRACVIMTLWIVAAVTITLIQFTTRRTRLSVVILTIVVVTGCAVTCWWPWNFFPGMRTAREIPRAPAPELHLAAGPLVRGLAVHAEYTAARSERNDLVIATEITQRLTWPDDALSVASAPPVADQLSRACAAFALDAPDRPGIPSDFELPNDSRRQRLLREAPRSLATITGTVMRAEVIATLPARTGEVSLQDGFRIKISEVIPNELRGVLLTVMESAPDRSADAWLGLFASPASPTAKEFYFLVNRAEGRALPAALAAAGVPLTAGTITYRRLELVFPLNQEQFARWVRTALLVKVVAHEAGSFSAVVETPLFEAKAPGSADGSTVPSASPL